MFRIQQKCLFRVLFRKSIDSSYLSRGMAKSKLTTVRSKIIFETNNRRPSYPSHSAKKAKFYFRRPVHFFILFKKARKRRAKLIFADGKFSLGWKKNLSIKIDFPGCRKGKRKLGSYIKLKKVCDIVGLVGTNLPVPIRITQAKCFVGKFQFCILMASSSQSVSRR